MNSPQKRFYLPELDALRCGAFCMVLLWHSYLYFGVGAHNLRLSGKWEYTFDGIFRAGIYGVDLFFTLSAYLITAILLRERARYGRVDIRNFYMRRMLRIWPLYFASIFLFQPLSRLLLPGDTFTHHQMLWFTLLVGNWSMILHGPVASWLQSFWSLNVEEQFYGVWPWMLRLRRSAILAGIAAMFFTAIIAQLLHTYHGPEAGVYYDTLARLQPIALGALLALLTEESDTLPTLFQRWMMGGTALGLFWVSGRFGDPFGPRCLFSFPVAALASVLLLLSVREIGWVPGALGRVAVYLGKISYGLYVFHMFWVEWMKERHINGSTKVAVTLLGTIVTAAVSYRFLEKPFGEIKDRMAPIRSRPA